MNLYSEWVFPRVLDWMMAGEPFRTYRQQLLAEAIGDVLEIGFGTGLNLPYYGDRVQSLHIIDPNPGMQKLAQPRLAQTQIPLEVQQLAGESLPMADDRFDTVVSTWTLCSITGIDQALGQIHRVLKPGGRFLFMEHGLSDRPEVQRWQRRLTPVQRVIADGCHLDRDIAALVGQWFSDCTWERFEEPNLPAIGGTFYRGVATKSLESQT